MIKRYQDPEIEDIWFIRAQYQRWQLVELCNARARLIQGEAGHEWDYQPIDSGFIENVRRRELQTQHDVVAFVDVLQERTSNRMIHYGLTSSDVVDTALALAIRASGERVRRCTTVLFGVLQEFDMECQIPMVGRTHTQDAFIMDGELRVRGWASKLRRAIAAYDAAEYECMVGKLSGPDGQHNATIEAMVLEDLALRPTEAIQAIPRDLYSNLVQQLMRLSNAMEQIAIDLRLLCSTAIHEITFTPERSVVGSSSMPHKTNPIVPETVCGLARLMRGYAAAMAENTNWWLERDIAHSSVERVVIPDAYHVVCTQASSLGVFITECMIDGQRIEHNVMSVPNSYQDLLSGLTNGRTRGMVYEAYKNNGGDNQ